MQSLKQIKNEYIYLNKTKTFIFIYTSGTFNKITMLSNVVYMLAIYYVESYKQNNGDRRDKFHH